ncbi:MAG: hypothetical protein GY943_28635, partial [Chloroflexi bacterium]|nr:hypothetical protein [Chloroflexota bacterium]
AIQATGSLAAATAIAEQLGIVSRANAIQIVNKISDTLLNELPRYHGLLPHWVKISPEGKFNIVNGTEWSSVDTTIAAMGLLGAKSSLALDTSDVEHMLQIIDWHDLKTVDGISHGYDNGGNRLASAWNVFGGESWLVELVYAGATGQVSSIPFTLPPTANGSGFIDEMAWLFVSPPPELDYWEADWKSYRLTAANDQISYYVTNYPESCLNQFGLFGLSASEIPYAEMANNGGVYQAFGIGGQFSAPNDGSAMGEPVVVPHYAAMIASIRPKEAIAMWEWLIQNEYFSPLNNVESLAFLSNQICEPAAATWNHLKGSWNLSLQTLGWGNYLIE